MRNEELVSNSKSAGETPARQPIWRSALQGQRMETGPERLLRPCWFSALNSTRLEVETQAELHTAGSREITAGDAEASGGELGCDRLWVEPNGIGDVVNLPGKVELAEITGVPSLGEAGVEVEVAVAAEVIALTGFAGVGEANRCAVLSAIGNGIAIAIKVLGIAVLIVATADFGLRRIGNGGET